MNTKHIILIVTLLIVGLFSCDNYVQFETAQPTDATVATTVPELFQGTYINPQDPNMAFTINEDGIYKYTSVRLPRLDSDKIKTSDCNLATDTFYTQPNGKKSQCVSVDFSSYPDSTITLLHFREALWHSDGDNIMKTKGDRLFLNKYKNESYELQCIDYNDASLKYYIWEIADLANEEEGIFAENLSLRRMETGKWQFVFGDTYNLFSKIDTTAYKKLVYVMVPVYEQP